MGLADRLLGKRRALVTMLVSVGGDHIAGRSYKIPVELSDQYVARGYAAGALSQEFTPDELQALKSTPQTVVISG